MKVKKRVEGETIEKNGFVFKKVKKGSLAKKPAAEKKTEKKPWFSGNSENIEDEESKKLFALFSQTCNEMVQSLVSTRAAKDVIREVLDTLSEWLDRVEKAMSKKSHGCENGACAQNPEIVDVLTRMEVLEEMKASYESEITKWKEFVSNKEPSNVGASRDATPVVVEEKEHETLRNGVADATRTLELQVISFFL